jgi:two-component system, OmpR family, response regulator
MTDPRLLIIEDVQGIADMIARAGAEAGFEIRHAFGSAARDLYDDFQPHAIVLDLLLHGMEDFEFLKFLQARRSASRTLIISGSSGTYRQAAETFGKSAGLMIEANLSKPFRIEQLRLLLAKVRISLLCELGDAAPP